MKAPQTVKTSVTRHQLEQHRSRRVATESSGRHHRVVHQALPVRGVELVLVNPLRTRRLAEALRQLATTGMIDAATLATYCIAFPDLQTTAP